MLTRRQLLVRGGAFASAAYLGSLGWPAQLGAPLVETAPMQKGIALGGFGALRAPLDPNDYTEWGNREYVRASGTNVVRLQVSWSYLQPQQPRSQADSWQQLNSEFAGALARLDRQVRAANDDGVRVIIGLYQSYPYWANGADPLEVEPGTGKPADAKLPLDVGADSEFAWFLAYLCARYARGPTSATGPRAQQPLTTGNPLGARMDALELCNEPNLQLWPQSRAVEVVAAMTRSAFAIADQIGSPPLLLLPATSDFPDRDLYKNGTLHGTSWHTYCARLLDELRDLPPRRVRLGWSHHNYRDTKQADGRSDRALEVMRLLATRDWPGERRLYLTEGGVNRATLTAAACPALGHAATADERRVILDRCQAEMIARNFSQMRVSGVALWTQYEINDQAPDDRFSYGLREDFHYEGATPVGPGEPRPAWYTWKML